MVKHERWIGPKELGERVTRQQNETLEDLDEEVTEIIKEETNNRLDGGRHSGNATRFFRANPYGFTEDTSSTPKPAQKIPPRRTPGNSS